VEDDRVISADLYAIALRAQGDFDSSYLEAGVLDRTDGTVWADVTLTYPANFANNNVYPVWTFYPEKQPLTEENR
ncbi:MAG: hypothetical protein IJX14_11215, partial [Clostridia bacterium]|nr:hypothetical protein [Clostridia bacterium]